MTTPLLNSGMNLWHVHQALLQDLTEHPPEIDTVFYDIAGGNNQIFYKSVLDKNAHPAFYTNLLLMAFQAALDETCASATVRRLNTVQQFGNSVERRANHNVPKQNAPALTREMIEKTLHYFSLLNAKSVDVLAKEGYASASVTSQANIPKIDDAIKLIRTRLAPTNG